MQPLPVLATTRKELIMPDYTHAKRIIEALEHKETVLHNSHTAGIWVESELNINPSTVIRLCEINDPAIYRVKTKPKLIPLSQEDIPPVCWVREKGLTGDRHYLINELTQHAVSSNITSWSYTALFACCEYSTDRKNWRPCSKESV